MKYLNTGHCIFNHSGTVSAIISPGLYIPLKAGEEIIGLLQLNDHRKEMFTLEMIHFFEDLGASIGVAFLRRQSEIDLLLERNKLQEALEKVKTLSGLLPICSSCKKIRDDKGYWNHLETYFSTYSDDESLSELPHFCRPMPCDILQC